MESETVCLGRVVGEIERKKKRRKYTHMKIFFSSLLLLKEKHSGGKNM